MAGRAHAIQNHQSAATYVNKKGINELFEAMMTALMVHKPDDHIAFIRECLDKVQNNPRRVRWDFFVTNSSNTKSALPSRPVITRNRPKALPPVRKSSSISRTNQTSNSRTLAKPVALPPIENSKKDVQNSPIIFILSSSNVTELCSRLMERYNQLTYFCINDIANIDEENQIDLKEQEHRYDSIQDHIEQQRERTRGFLIAGHLNEKNFCQKWQEKLGRIDLIILLSSDQQTISNQNLHFIEIDSNNDFDTILTSTIRATDEIFPRNVTSIGSLIENESHRPIIFCIDNHRLAMKENQNKFVENPLIDEEFETASAEQEGEISNSFIYTLSERLAEQFSLKHIHCGESNEIRFTFEQLKISISQSMSTSTGYIIDHFPTSFDDLRKFQREIGSCSLLIYIGEHQTEGKDDELSIIVEEFKEMNKAIYIDSRMEVDEIYEDLKNDILKHI